MKISYSDMNGQALVESIFIIPIFFLLLSGIIILFQGKLRIMTDENVLSGQLLSFAYLNDEEKWSEIKSEKIVSQQTLYSFMPSKFFKNSVDQIDGLFFDKVYLNKNEAGLKNKNTPQYSIFNSLKGIILLETWAYDSNYEREKNLPFKFEFRPSHKIYEEQNIFYPSSELDLENRNFKVLKSVTGFSKTLESQQYSQQQASFFFPLQGEFVQKCLMQPFSPRCSLQTIQNILNRTVVDSTNFQISLCFAEATSRCTGSGPAIAACVASKIVQIKNAIELGVPAWVCPLLNAKSREVRIATNFFVSSELARFSLLEAQLRGEFVSNLEADKKNEKNLRSMLD
ncbi:hypothetical protein QEJ31_01050 [Pigmentibacter sp. JX0631]|uniref:hypothetical protein n=1 Tax=Pigmentibacter sp. JX0631 TaxID=2976982 RepID=UPI002469839E|nr:hypothetical protein [Pigmentibacter sp. JX0631]WGL60190.1 hypothetical protein QEJ31_01050 [Pigmentibacter sp. JX0631]